MQIGYKLAQPRPGKLLWWKLFLMFVSNVDYDWISFILPRWILLCTCILRHPIHQTFKNLCKNLQKLWILSDAAANISHLNLKAVIVARVIWEVQQEVSPDWIRDWPNRKLLWILSALMNAGITVRRSTSSAIGIVSDLICLLFFFVFFELTSGLPSKTKVSQVQLLFPCSIFSVSLRFHLSLIHGRLVGTSPMPEMRITKHSAVMATSSMWLLLAAFTSVHQTQHLCIRKHSIWSYLCWHNNGSPFCCEAQSTNLGSEIWDWVFSCYFPVPFFLSVKRFSRTPILRLPREILRFTSSSSQQKFNANVIIPSSWGLQSLCPEQLCILQPWKQ